MVLKRHFERRLLQRTDAEHGKAQHISLLINLFHFRTRQTPMNQADGTLAKDRVASNRLHVFSMERGHGNAIPQALYFQQIRIYRQRPGFCKGCNMGMMGVYWAI